MLQWVNILWAAWKKPKIIGAFFGFLISCSEGKLWIISKNSPKLIQCCSIFDRGCIIVLWVIIFYNLRIPIFRGRYWIKKLKWSKTSKIDPKFSENNCACQYPDFWPVPKFLSKNTKRCSSYSAFSEIKIQN